ncbi:cysteine desulfurase family protein [Mycobacterium sp. 1245801.1]|uniref:cysteine desulfurase family protein n=1 Tax=Mycobacterium sp. 1245801.1 TaxID=1834075 RepID=UPI0007FDEFD7|nr:cysteine desulfurase family protein [Mycobacterium sp. 1245801.1]OBJ25624.1 cysteine desulfurase [Mycobacterium sp. 1245801.1]
MVYLDYNASTPVDQRILAVLGEAHGVFGNPSSLQHIGGQAAGEIVEEARNRVATFARRPGQDVIFTSGATEAAVIALLGVMLGVRERPNVVVSAAEHKAILAAVELGARLSGGEVRTVSVDRDGVVDLNELDALTDDSVAVVAVMAANNETGVLGPVAEVADIAERHGAFTFVDATQLVGKGSLDEVTKVADILIFSSHKVYGPKGAGALIADRHVQKVLVPIAGGGGQERGLRGGTQNTPSIAGFGLAAELAMKEQLMDAVRVGRLADTLLAELRRDLRDIHVNGAGAKRLSNTLNLRFAGADAEAVMASMPDVQVSAGSACQSAVPTPSHVLLAMGASSVEASESLRISLGRPTTEEDVRVAARSIAAAVTRVRELTSD